MKRIRSLAAQTFEEDGKSNLILSLLSSAVGFAAVPLLTLSHNKELAAVWIWASALTGLIGLAALGSNYAVTTVSARISGIENLWVRLRPLCIAVVITSVASVVLFLTAISGLLSDFIPTPGSLRTVQMALFLTLGVGFSRTLHSLISSAFRGLFSPSLASLQTLTLSLLRLSVCVGSILLSVSSLVFLALLICSHLLAITFSLLIIGRISDIRHPSPPDARAANAAELAMMGLKAWPADVASSLFGSVDRLLVLSLRGDSAFVIYSYSTSVVNQCMALVGAFAAPLQTAIAREEGVASQESRGLIVKVVQLACLLFVTVVSMLAISSFGLFGSDSFTFRDATLLSLVLAGSYLSTSLSSIPFFILQGSGRFFLVSVTSLVSVFVCLALVWWLARFGLVGAAIASFSFAIQNLLWIAVLKQHEIQLNMRETFLFPTFVFFMVAIGLVLLTPGLASVVLVISLAIGVAVLCHH